MTIVPGSARGVRVAGAVWGVIIAGSLVVGFVGFGEPTAWWFALLVPAFAMIRPWWMGVVVTNDGFVVRSWFRHYRVRADEVTSVELAEVYSAILGAGTGWIPFVGSVRMLQVGLAGRATPRPFPATLGRRNTVLKLARVLREHMAVSDVGDFTL